MSTAEYAQKLVRLIEARPHRINLDKLLYEIYVRAKIAEARRERELGYWKTNAEVMEAMWERIALKSDGRSGRKKTSQKSSAKSRKTRR